MSGRHPNAGDTIRNCDACQFIALVEGPITDAGDAIRNGNSCQAPAATEGVQLNTGDAVRKQWARQDSNLRPMDYESTALTN